MIFNINKYIARMYVYALYTIQVAHFLQTLVLMATIYNNR